MSVSSVSSSSSSSIYGSRSSNIISGLASGLDTESMIEGMVSGIKSKIDTQKQNQQILMWQQEAFRSISDQARADFQQVYFLYFFDQSDEFGILPSQHYYVLGQICGHDFGFWQHQQ